MPAKEVPDAEYTIANDASKGYLLCGQWHILALTLMLLLGVFLWPKGTDPFVLSFPSNNKSKICHRMLDTPFLKYY